jgi:ATP-dependent RNA helicase DDX3X
MSFKAAGLHPAMLRNTELAGYDVPTPIQQYTMPAVFEGRDIVACAQTGKLNPQHPTCLVDHELT